MKKILLIVIVIFPFLSSFTPGFDRNLVEVTSTFYNNEKFISIKMSREGERIKAKYFAYKEDGDNVYTRYTNWAKNKNVILFTGAAYFSGTTYDDAVPVGLTIDDGNVVNRNLLTPGLDGLAIVYATGGIACSNISEGNLYIKCGDQGKTLDVRRSLDLLDFVRCAQSQSATVFQQHLLVYKDKVTIYNNSNQTKRERRFLAVGKDSKNQMVHTIVHYPTSTTLLDGTKKVFAFLKNYKNMKEIIFMLNLDTGYQDVFRLFDNENNLRKDIIGPVEPQNAVNLLVYYYE